MRKALIVKFVKEKRRGVYDAIVDEYSSIIFSWKINLLVNIIETDLEHHTGEKVILNYFGLAKAIRKFKLKPTNSKKEKPLTPHAKQGYDFKDAHELEEKEATKPGSFKL